MFKSFNPATGMRGSAACLAAGAMAMLASSTALAGLPVRGAPQIVDAGRVADRAAATPITVTLVLKLRDLAGAEALLRRVSTPGDALHGKFLTPQQFNAAFGATDENVAAISKVFAGYGLTAERMGTSTMHLTGTPDKLERAFGVSLHQFNVADTASKPGFSYRAPLQRPTMPAAVAAMVYGVDGLDTRQVAHTHLLRAPDFARPQAAPRMQSGGNAPGELTVVDFANHYNAAPLYTAGVNGTGQTVGIVTLASFTQNDAYRYWRQTGLIVSQARIAEIQVDGGAGPISDAGGSDETTLDVEQSGGIARGANIRVYEAPNTSQGYVDAFAAVVQDNVADTVSTSWGEWEAFDELQYSPVTDPVGGATVSALAAQHQLFVQAGTQGQSMFAAAGDAGAYDVNREAAPPTADLTLTVDSPASDTAMTAAGGTTLAATLTFRNGTVITVPKERVWGWDYLLPLCQALALDPVTCGIVPVGGGGGVSIEFAVPNYQMQLAGVKKTAPDQQLKDYTTVPPTIVYTLPAGFAGRNVPDISADADPETGYILGYTSSAGGGYAVSTFFGGTSFVAPQLNGVASMLDQYVGHRLGFVNPMLYMLGKSPMGYTPPANPLNAIKTGGNEYYTGRDGYAPAAGLGTLNVLNVAHLAKQ